MSNYDNRRGENMPRINVMYEIGPDYLLDDSHYIKIKKEKGKNVKISDRVFELMLSEGLLRKTDDGYVFVGKYEDLKGKKKKH